MNVMVIHQRNKSNEPPVASVPVEHMPAPANSATMLDPHQIGLSFDELTADERAELLGLIEDALA